MNLYQSNSQNLIDKNNRSALAEIKQQNAKLICNDQYLDLDHKMLASENNLMANAKYYKLFENKLKVYYIYINLCKFTQSLLQVSKNRTKK